MVDGARQRIISRRAKLVAAAIAAAGIGAMADGGVDGGVPPGPMLASSFPTPAAVGSQPPPIARPWLEEARKFAASQDWVEALECFRKAYELSPQAKILRRIAELSEKVGDVVNAIAACDALLQSADDALQGMSREEIAAFRNKLLDKVGHLVLDTHQSTDGMTAVIDGKMVGAIPLGQDLLVNPGQHLVEIRMGESRKTWSISVGGGQVKTVHIELPPLLDGGTQPMVCLQPGHPIEPVSGGCGCRKPPSNVARSE